MITPSRGMGRAAGGIVVPADHGLLSYHSTNHGGDDPAMSGARCFNILGTRLTNPLLTSVPRW